METLPPQTWEQLPPVTPEQLDALKRGALYAHDGERWFRVVLAPMELPIVRIALTDDLHLDSAIVERTLMPGLQATILSDVGR